MISGICDVFKFFIGGIFMRRANGSGSIFKMKGTRRRNPWRVRVTEGWESNGTTGESKQIVRTIGYYPSRHEAELALNEYLENPYDISDKDLTLSELYEKWSEQYFVTLTKENDVRVEPYSVRL